MEIFYVLLTLALMGASYAVGLGRGRWGDKRAIHAVAKACGCGHGNYYHRQGGRGSCGWEGYNEKYKSNMSCTCRQFTAAIDGED